VFDIQNYTSFLVAILVFQLIPGPGTLAILNATARSGISAGLNAVLGTLTGDVLFMVAALAGLASVMNTNPILFQTLQWLGVSYLCWTGLQLLRSPASQDTTKPEPLKSPRRYFRQAFAISLTNPNVLLFFVSFFPLFVRPGSKNTTLVAMIIHVTTINFLYQVSLVFIGNAVARRLRAIQSARMIAAHFAGIALIGFGVKLAISIM
jgi:threonine/homoserine/homoserine lactone efflux protein